MTPAARVNLALFAAAATLLGAALSWSSVALGPREARSRALAEAALDRIAERERALPPGRGYAAFGPGPGEREAALPGLALGAAEADFTFDALPDALPDPTGALRLRAVSRPDAVGAGRAVPLLLVRMLAGATELGHEGPNAGRSGPAAAPR